METSKTLEGSSSRLTVLLTLIISISVPLIVALRIIATGYRPMDDALRHVAKVFSGKSWSEILVLRPVADIESHVGWDAVLTFFQGLTQCNRDGLLVFAVISLFCLVTIVPLFLVKRSEAWFITLVIMAAFAPAMLSRFMIGRPLLITSTVLLVICFGWKKLSDKHFYPSWFVAVTVCITLSVWMHGSWYLFALPLGCFVLARQWKGAVRLGVAILIGVSVGLIMTGHPVASLEYSLYLVFNSPDQTILSRMLVGELRPRNIGNIFPLLAGGLLIVRYLCGRWSRECVDNPVFILVGCGYVLGFFIGRFWLDWGMIAFMAWVAFELDDLFENRLAFSDNRRLAVVVPAAIAFLVISTSDLGSRWTKNLTNDSLIYDEATKEEKSWYPGPDGIFYSARMRFFFETFYHNPAAHWRYLLGYEPTVMPPQYLEIFRQIQWNNRAIKTYKPWVEKMRPEDRLVIHAGKGNKPSLPSLEWKYLETGKWVGRLPRKQRKGGAQNPKHSGEEPAKDPSVHSRRQ